jgi:hypothetical protein
MLANFIESSPLPVKAVLAMMGKIEEVYRLPLLPMRRDTRSKLQKIATDAGLIARPAAPPAAATEFYIYENWAAGPHKAMLHRASCGQCSSGKGRPAGHDPNHSRWHGPYGNVTEAREATHQMPGSADPQRMQVRGVRQPSAIRLVSRSAPRVSQNALLSYVMPDSLSTLKSAIEHLATRETIDNPDEARPLFSTSAPL